MKELYGMFVKMEKMEHEDEEQDELTYETQYIEEKDKSQKVKLPNVEQQSPKQNPYSPRK